MIVHYRSGCTSVGIEKKKKRKKYFNFSTSHFLVKKLIDSSCVQHNFLFFIRARSGRKFPLLDFSITMLNFFPDHTQRRSQSRIRSKMCNIPIPLSLSLIGVGNIA